MSQRRTIGQSLQTLRQRIRPRERLPVWVMRLVFGVMLLMLSELVMWQRPDSHAIWEWPILVLMYTALGAIIIDLLVRFQARDLGGLLLVSGIYGLVSSVIISHSAFENVPFSFIIRAMGLQTAAGFYGIMLFITIMRGKDTQIREIIAAVAVGIIWGIWVHWYPVQPNIAWNTEAISIQTAILYLLPAMIITGLLIYFGAPRFRVFREQQMTLVWWEAIITGLPLFISLLVGMVQINAKGDNTIPAPWLVVAVVVGVFCVWALRNRERGYEPSILADVMFTAPNVGTYVVLSLAFIMAGTIAYSTVTDLNSPVGVVTYFAIFAFGAAWLPLASLLIFWPAFKAATAPIDLSDDDEEEGDDKGVTSDQDG